GWFVENYELRSGQKCLRDPQALAHAVRILAHLMVRAPSQPDQLERLVDQLFARTTGKRGEHRCVVEAGEVFMERRRLNNRTNARKRTQRMSRHVVSEEQRATTRG